MPSPPPVNLMTRVGRLPKRHVFLIAVICVVVLSAVDELTGPDISVMYLAPVAFATWLLGLLPGVLIAAASALAGLLVNLLDQNLRGAHSLWPYWRAATNAGILFIVAYLLSALRIALRREQELARTDHLTSVANTRYFFEHGVLELERARRYQRPLTLAYIDIDNFKTVNDRFGHSAGDRILRLTAQTIQQHVRLSDILARLGGDEFVVLIPEAGPNSAGTILRKLQAVLAEAARTNGHSVTFSIGAVTFNRPPASLDEMLKQADDYLYDIKRGGKNNLKVVVADEPDPPASS
ncbi:MAG: GGDEF domain-containing protein [Chloroflexi bacterium]|nr:GGDEF domain-containing protein [Chloroflexota bacterium]